MIGTLMTVALSVVLGILLGWMLATRYYRESIWYYDETRRECIANGNARIAAEDELAKLKNAAMGR